jgi:hypothetical protein
MQVCPPPEVVQTPHAFEQQRQVGAVAAQLLVVHGKCFVPFAQLFVPAARVSETKRRRESVCVFVSER